MPKPKFDPNKPFQEVSEKPKFDPTKPFDEVNTSGMSGSEKAQAAIEGAGNALTFGYLPQIQAVTEGLLPNPHSEADKRLKQQGIKIQESPNAVDRYLQRRDENLNRQEKYAKETPGYYYGGQLAGGLVQAPVSAVALGKAIAPLKSAKDLGLLGRLGQVSASGAIAGAVQNPGDEQGKINPLQTSDRIKNAQIGAVIGAGAQLGGETIGKAAKTVRSLPEKTQKLARAQAFKSAGPMLKDFRKAFEKGKVEELGKEMIDSGMIKPGANFESIADHSSKIKQEVGGKIGSIYDQIKGKVSLKIDPQKMYSEMIDAVSDPKVRPKIGTEAYDDAMGKVMEGIVKNKENLNDIRYVNDLIGEIDGRINYSKRANDLPEVQAGYLKLRQFLRDRVNTIAEETGKMTGDPTLGKQLKELNRRYANMTQINRIAADRVSRESANQYFSLGDKVVAAGGLNSGLPAALGLGLISKGVREYGSPIATLGLNKLGGMAKSVPKPISRGLLEAGQAIKRDPTATGLLGGGLINKKESR